MVASRLFLRKLVFPPALFQFHLYFAHIPEHVGADDAQEGGSDQYVERADGFRQETSPGDQQADAEYVQTDASPEELEDNEEVALVEAGVEINGASLDSTTHAERLASFGKYRERIVALKNAVGHAGSTVDARSVPPPGVHGGNRPSTPAPPARQSNAIAVTTSSGGSGGATSTSTTVVEQSFYDQNAVEHHGDEEKESSELWQILVYGAYAKAKQAQQVVMLLPLHIQEQTAFLLSFGLAAFMDPMSSSIQAADFVAILGKIFALAGSGDWGKNYPPGHDDAAAGVVKKAQRSVNVVLEGHSLEAILGFGNVKKDRASKIHLDEDAVGPGGRREVTPPTEEMLAAGVRRVLGKKTDEDGSGKMDLIELTHFFYGSNAEGEAAGPGSVGTNKEDFGNFVGVFFPDPDEKAAVLRMLYGEGAGGTDDPSLVQQQYCEVGEYSVYVCDAGNRQGELNPFLTVDFQHHSSDSDSSKSKASPKREPLEMDTSLCKLYNFAFPSNMESAPKEQVEEVGKACEALVSETGQNCCHWVPDDTETNACRPFYRCLKPVFVQEGSDVPRPPHLEGRHDVADVVPKFQEVFEDGDIGDVGTLEYFHQPVNVHSILPPFAEVIEHVDRRRTSVATEL